VAGRWLTPPLAAGVLPGVMRSVVLADASWDAIEAPVTRAMLEGANEIMVCNALRGTLAATLA
jgi:para-aminobenzoate synthetase/4-amino-4-deoxychorismate lyase